MNKDELIKAINELFEDFDIGKIQKIEYKGKNKNNKNKFKIRYTPNFMSNCYVDETIIEK